MIEKQYDRPIKALRIDVEGEFNSIDFIGYYKYEGIEHEVTAPYTP